MSSSSSMTLSICYIHVGEPYFEVVATIFLFPYERVVRKINFMVWKSILLRFFAIVKEMARGGTTSGIRYNLFPKVITTEWGLKWYTSCHLHKYGWPNNTSATLRGATSHNTSFVNGLMLYRRRHYWWMRRSLPRWSHPMVYNCGCVMVSRKSCFTTFVEMRL